MSTLNRLFELHLIAEENEVLCASSHCNGIRQRHLASFINKEEIERPFPLRQGKQPCSPADDTVRISGACILVRLDVSEGGIICEQQTLMLAPDLDPLERPPIVSRKLAAFNEQIHHGLVAVRCDAHSLP